MCNWPNTWRLSICVLSSLAAMPLSALAVDPPVGAKGEATKMEIASFGELPVRFNGRVTTIANVAPIALASVSSSDFFIDNDGRKHSAVRWLLDVITDSEGADDYRIVPIRDLKLLTALGFDDDPKVRRFKTKAEPPKPPVVRDAPRFSVAEIRPKFSWIDEQAERIVKDVEYDDYSEFQHALVDLNAQLQSYVAISFVQQFPDLKDVETFKQLYQALDRFDQYAWFQLVPARGDTWQWQTVLRAAVMLRADEVLEKEPNPATASLRAIFAAYRDKDADTFNRLLAAYQKWAKANAVARSPVSFAVPKTWRETGVRLGNGNQFFDSVLANGQTAAEFDIGEDGQLMKAFLRHFTGETMPDAQIYNDWRIGFGLMPLSQSQLAKTGTPITISGHRGFYVDLVPSAGIETVYKRIVGTVIRHGDHTFLINVGLPDVVTHHKRTFESFAASLKFASDEELSRWFPESQAQERYGLQTTTVALVPDASRLWSFQLIETANGVVKHSQRVAFEKLIRSISPQGGNPTAGIRWVDPESWQRGDQNQPIIYSLQSDVVSAFIKIHVVGNAIDADRLPLVNLWRIQSGLPAWQQRQMNEAAREMRVAGRNAILMDFETPPAPAPPNDSQSNLTYQVPQGWSAGKKSVFRKASFQVRDGDKRADVSVTALRSSGDSLVKNVNRWRAQVNLDAVDAATIRESVKKFSVDENAGHVVDITGTNGTRILAVVVDREGQTWFFKMMGDEPLVEREKRSFENFVKSVRFEDWPN